MYALRERRVHVTQEDFELAVAKVTIDIDESLPFTHRLLVLGHAKGFGEECLIEEALEVMETMAFLFYCQFLCS